jgi:dUTP pyrophosphatase
MEYDIPLIPALPETEIQCHLLSPNAKLPNKATSGSAGYDVYTTQNHIIKPLECIKIPTDIALTCPPGTYARIADRSSIAYPHSLFVLAGVIDSDYRGNIYVVLYNGSAGTIVLPRHAKFAQIIFEKIENNLTFQSVSDPLPDSTRGQDGFGAADAALDGHCG